MSYFLADSTKVLAEFASIGGYADFKLWAAQQKAPVRRFVHFGFTEDLQGLYDALQNVQAPAKVQEQVALLLEYSKDAQDVLIVSDGLSSLDSPTTASSKDNELHGVADKLHKKFLVAVKYAFAAGRAAVNKTALASARTAAEASHAVSKAPGAVHEALSKVLPPLWQQAFAGGQAAGVQRLRGKLRIASAIDDFLHTSFDASNPIAAEWARQHGGKTIDGLTATTQQDIAEAIAQAEEDGDLSAAYDAILAAVGDEDRAQLITQDQLMTATNEGQRESWDDAVDKGLLSPDAQRTWIAAEGCCDDCDELDGETTGLDEDYPDDGGDGPPLHPRCRCTEGITSA